MLLVPTDRIAQIDNQNGDSPLEVAFGFALAFVVSELFFTERRVGGCCSVSAGPSMGSAGDSTSGSSGSGLESAAASWAFRLATSSSRSLILSLFSASA